MIVLLLWILKVLGCFLAFVAGVGVTLAVSVALRSSAPGAALALFASLVRGAALMLFGGALGLVAFRLRPLRHGFGRAAAVLFERARREDAFSFLGTPKSRGKIDGATAKLRLMVGAFVREDPTIPDDKLTHVFVDPERPRAVCGRSARRGSLLCDVSTGLALADETLPVLASRPDACPHCAEGVLADEVILEGMVRLHAAHVGKRHPLFRTRDEGQIVEVYFWLSQPEPPLNSGDGVVVELAPPYRASIRRSGCELVSGFWWGICAVSLVGGLALDKPAFRVLAAMDRLAEVDEAGEDDGEEAIETVTLPASRYFGLKHAIADAGREIASILASENLAPTIAARLSACAVALNPAEPDDPDDDTSPGELN